MTLAQFQCIERYMLEQMRESAHDSQHVYRVLYLALDIASHEPAVNADLLIAACLLHDVGRGKKGNHAAVGAKMAQDFLLSVGWGEEFAREAAACIRTHRYRSDAPPVSLEARILFDADKLDVTGAIGMARTLLYQGAHEAPLYTLTLQGEVCDGTGDAPPSFLQEYRFKLEKIYDRFFTARGAELGAQRRKAAQDFYGAVLHEARADYDSGRALLRAHLEPQ